MKYKYIVLIYASMCVSLAHGAQLRNIETTISVKAHVTETIFVDVSVNGDIIGFGVCSRADYGRGPIDGGKCEMGGPHVCKGNVEILWGIDGEDSIAKDHKVVFDTKKFIPQSSNIRAVVYEYHGNGKWVMKLYDKYNNSDDKKLIGEDTLIEPWRQRQWLNYTMVEMVVKNNNKSKVLPNTIMGNIENSWGLVSGYRRDIIPIDIGRLFILQWGIEGVDGIAMRRKVAFDTMKFYNKKNNVKSIEFVIDGDYCTIKLYDSLQGEAGRRLLGEDKQKYVWLEGMEQTYGGVPIPIPEGYELSVTCNPENDTDPNVPTEITASVIADGYEEEFGLIESQCDKKTGKHVYCSRIRAYWPFEIGKDFDIVWYDKVNHKFSVSVPTGAFADVKEKAKALELVYEGDKKWKIILYDDIITKAGRTKLKEMVAGDQK